MMHNQSSSRLKFDKNRDAAVVVLVEELFSAIVRTMSSSAARLLFALLFVGTASVGGWALRDRQRAVADTVLLRERAHLLEDENERLRGALAGLQREGTESRNTVARAEIEKAVTQLRGLKFKTPVTYDVVTRDAILAELGKKLNEVLTDADFENYAAGYAALGLLPEGYPLKKKMAELLGEQVAAFYDQHAHKLFMFADANLTGAQNRVILAHELTHALQDQHFSLNKLPLEIKDNDDIASAAGSLVEGDATVLMNAYAVQNISLGLLTDSLGGMFTQSTAKLQAAPRMLRETLLFPYLSGMQFCQAVLDEGGEAALNGVYAAPPSSTSQILHPERYMADPREKPVAIGWADVSVPGLKFVTQNTLGELGTRILLCEWGCEADAPEVAAGWRGDRYAVYDGGGSFAWKSVWRSVENADKFMEVIREGLKHRHGAATTRTTRVEHTGPAEVLVIDAAGKDAADALERRFSKKETNN
jgi:hypothetical protein